MTTTLDALHGAGILSPLDVHFARAMGRIADESRQDVLLAAALLSRHVGNGHVCLDVARLAEGTVLIGDSGVPLSLQALPALDAWHALLQSSPLVGAPSDETMRLADSIKSGSRSFTRAKHDY